MTPLVNDPAQFADEALAGFVAAHPDLVTAVPGGVVRAGGTRSGKVAVVVGGGSGHYPAFCGLVGPGLADGAVVGNVFTSPSAADVASVVRAADGGSGALLLTGNYAGDCMNFTLAAGQLQAEGIDTRYVVVTDDIASAPRGQEPARRGIAGDLIVFKIAAAAAEQGRGLADVEEIARRANERTRTIGVAFDGCTLPGSDRPLFGLPAGHIGIGVGIHGEPGIADAPVMTARDLGALLVEHLLAEQPAAQSGRVALVLNGLGRTKYEELFVLWATIGPLISEAGLTVVQPDVGEFVTSLDMAGCSLSMTWLDDVLEHLWTTPSYTPAYRKGTLAAGVTPSEAMQRPAARTSADEPMPERGGPASPEARRLAEVLAAGIDRSVDALARNELALGRLDAVAGDGDHGRGMLRGAYAAQAAARAAVEAHEAAGLALAEAGRAWAREAGGTSGVIWGAMLEAAGSRLVDTPEAWARWNRDPVAVVADALGAAIDAAGSLGGAAVGDKTLLDSLVPFHASFTAWTGSPTDVHAAWRAAAQAAEDAARATAALSPRRGRARPLADRSIGHPDPGATSLALIAAACAGMPDIHIDESPEEASS